MLALWFHSAFEETEVQRMLVTCPRYRRHKEIESSGDKPSGWQWILPLFAKLFCLGSWKSCWMLFKMKDLLLTSFSSTEVLSGCELNGGWERLGPSNEMHFILEQVLRARLSPTRYERKQFKRLKQRMERKRLVVKYMQQPRQADAQPPWAAGFWALVSESPEPVRYGTMENDRRF